MYSLKAFWPKFSLVGCAILELHFLSTCRTSYAKRALAVILESHVLSASRASPAVQARAVPVIESFAVNGIDLITDIHPLANCRGQGRPH